MTLPVPTYEEDIGRLLPADWKDPLGYEVRRSYLEHVAYEAGDAFVETILAAIAAHLKGEQWPHDCPAIDDWLDALQDLDRGRLYYAASRRQDGAGTMQPGGEYPAGFYLFRVPDTKLRIANRGFPRVSTICSRGELRLGTNWA